MYKSVINFEKPEKDLLFKKVFSNKEILNDFIKSFYEYIGKEEKIEVLKATPQKLLLPKNKKNNHFYGDVIATLSNNTILSLEMYSGKFSEEEYNKSYMYASYLFSNQSFKNYRNIKKVISLNLINSNYKRTNEEIINEYNFENIVTHKVINNNIELYLVRYDLAKEEKDSSKFIRYLKLLNEEDIECMKKLVEGDDTMECALRKIIDWNEEKNEVSFNDWFMDRYGYKWEEKIEDRGIAIGEKRGKEEGIAIGEENAKIKIAKNMLANNLPEDYIKRITGLSDSEIENLKDNE